MLESARDDKTKNEALKALAAALSASGLPRLACKISLKSHVTYFHMLVVFVDLFAAAISFVRNSQN